MENSRGPAARDGTGLRTLERGLAVLELLGSAEGGYPLSEVAQRLGLPVGTTHRLLQTLVNAGYVEQDPRTRAYQLGLKILELRGATAGAMRIAAEARPHLRDLMLRSGLRVHLAVYRGGGVVYIDRVDNPSSLGRYVPLGMRAPAHATSLGKALLAHSDEEEVTAYLNRHPLTGFTATTLTDAESFRRELALTRQRGYSLDRGEHREETHCVAAPIFDYTGRVVAAVSVAGTIDEVTPRIPEIGQLVAGTARDVSRRFGYRPPEELAHPDRELVTGWEAELTVRARRHGDPE